MPSISKKALMPPRLKCFNKIMNLYHLISGLDNSKFFKKLSRWQDQEEFQALAKR